MGGVSEKDARARGVAAARGGKGVLSNPFTGARAKDWRRGFDSVPAEQRAAEPSREETGPPIPTCKGMGRIHTQTGNGCTVVRRREELPHDWRGGIGQR